MNTNALRRFIAIAISLPTLITAQAPIPHDPTRLANWAAPLYWQPSPAERAAAAAAGTLAPQAATNALSNALVFVAITPCRVMDTRADQGFAGAFGPPSVAAGLPVRTIPMQSSTVCSIPSAAQAYSLNVTVVPAGGLLYLTVYPANVSAPPNASTLNDPSGVVLANAAIVPAGTDTYGSVSVYASGATDLIIDINGYYCSPGALNLNTALGSGALANVTSGTNNTAAGAQALADNTYGTANTAVGARALESNTGGTSNTAVGAGALILNTTGNENTATGGGALESNTTGYQNTATGAFALEDNTIGFDNTALGFGTLTNNLDGEANTAIGGFALNFNKSGGGNTASGSSALQNNTSGIRNTANGFKALVNNTTGSDNIAIGTWAAINLTSGSSNIHIGNRGAATDSGTIRIGSAAGSGSVSVQTTFFAAGIRGVTTGNNDAIPVVIDSNGQLGTVNSSARFKQDTWDMRDASEGLLRLRPVIFRYRRPFADGSKPEQYGLIAEEVARVYPELVARSADGEIESIKYQALDSMLLNELQKQAAKIQEQTEQNRQCEEEIQLLKQRLVAAEEALAKAANR